MGASRTHYEILGVDPSADLRELRAAFRHQIARYHPDKVVHLGQEFQDLAAARTAALTEAYQTLIDEAARRDYDASLVVCEVSTRSTGPRFESERAGGRGLVQRALVARVRTVVTDLYGDVDTLRWDESVRSTSGGSKRTAGRSSTGSPGRARIRVGKSNCLITFDADGVQANSSGTTCPVFCPTAKFTSSSLTAPQRQSTNCPSVERSGTSLLF